MRNCLAVFPLQLLCIDEERQFKSSKQEAMEWAVDIFTYKGGTRGIGPTDWKPCFWNEGVLDGDTLRRGLEFWIKDEADGVVS